MLYDPKWEQKTKADPLSLGSALAWLKQQDPNTTYSFWSGDCALCRYLKANNMALNNYSLLGTCSTRIAIFNTKPRNYGAALERARAVLAPR